ncbi:hypothetical protein E2C01_072184 [Portunus trituberculatus]|uniref:Uncharacterized protein n=1 Tax=Portunus trituberculatus TaxID=210409 RepID=A0A5B7HXB7_PORTR|nr:hypothetical protein [Portunus trituberculatus]
MHGRVILASRLIFGLPRVSRISGLCGLGGHYAGQDRSGGGRVWPGQGETGQWSNPAAYVTVVGGHEVLAGRATSCHVTRRQDKSILAVRGLCYPHIPVARVQSTAL